MADTVGTGVVAGAINQSEALQLKRNELEENKRARVAGEFQVAERTKLMKKESQRADFETMQNVQAHADKIVGVASKAMTDLYAQQEEAMAEYQNVIKEQQKIYPKKQIEELNKQNGVEKSYEKIIADTPSVKAAEAKVLKLQEEFDKVQGMVSENSQFLPFSSAGAGAEELFKYEMSPYERATTPPEELTAYGQDQIEAMNDIVQKREEFNNALMAGQIYASEEAKARAQHPYRMEEVEAQMSGRMQEAAQKAQTEQIDNVATVLATDITTTVNDMVQQINNTLKLEKADEGELRTFISSPETVAQAQKSFYGMMPAPMEAMNQDALSLSTLTSVMAQPMNEDDAVDFYRNQLPVIINYMTGGAQLSPRDEKILNDKNIYRLSEYPGTSNPLSGVVGKLAQLSNAYFVDDDSIKKFGATRWITSQSRNTGVPSVGGQ